uniref:Rod shape-determining protein MreD n=1 Tax=Globodera pallida TaxID=36090 RepID=A0A183C3J1_GLOPA
MSSAAFISVVSVLANEVMVPFIFALIIGIPSALLYCFELWVIISNFSKFKSAFFVLVSVRGILSLENQILFLANYNQYPWVNDLSTIAIPAWLLLWASTKMREIISKKFKWIGQLKKKLAIKVHPISPIV